MKRTLMLSVALLVGSPFAIAQKMPLEGVGTKHVAPAAAASAYGGIALPGNPEGLDIPRLEIFGSYSMAIPAPSWGLPSNTRGIGFDTSVSFNLTRRFAAEGDFGWSRAWAHFPGVTLTDNGMLFSGGPRFTYRQGRLSVFVHTLFGANRLSISSTVAGLTILGTSIPGATLTDTSLAALIGAGADIELRPHIALRNQVDYLPHITSARCRITTGFHWASS